MLAPMQGWLSDSFNTQPPEGGWAAGLWSVAAGVFVSTHSRLKAAGHIFKPCLIQQISFNTQPPEGGWFYRAASCITTQTVSTHSRLKAAGWSRWN